MLGGRTSARPGPHLIRVQVWIPRALCAQLDEAAKAQGLKRAQLIRVLLVGFVRQRHEAEAPGE